MHDMGELNKHNSTVKKTKSTGQASYEIYHNNSKDHTPLMIDLLPIELMVQNQISAYLRLKSQLNNAWAALNIKHIPHLLPQYDIKMQHADESNSRVWEDTQYDTLKPKYVKNMNRLLSFTSSIK